MKADEIDAVLIVHAAGFDFVGEGDAVFGDVDFWETVLGIFFVDADQEIAQTLRIDFQPMSVRPSLASGLRGGFSVLT